MKFYEDEINAKRITNFVEKFNQTKNKIKKEIVNKKKAEILLKEKKDLKDLILAKYNKDNSESFLDGLLNKYGEKSEKEKWNKEKTKSKPEKNEKIKKK